MVMEDCILWCGSHIDCLYVVPLQGSVTQGKGRKLAGLEQARFRAQVMRQTGFIEPDAC